MTDPRVLSLDEIQIARAVFTDSIAYENVRIVNAGSGAMVAAVPTFGPWHFHIRWSANVYSLGVREAREQGTFIHEMTHVWQGNNGVFPAWYMAESAAAQGSHGIRDIRRTKNWRNFIRDWDTHRSATTYDISMADIGKNWSDFNVEQQGTIVESWWTDEADRRRKGRGFGTGVFGGGASVHDPRFPYIRDVIRGRNRRAAYRAPQLAPGADPAIKQIQDKLVALAYLPASQADGFVGRSRSATLDAVERFQRRNGLTPDRVLGGPNSDTRKKLALPSGQLNAAAL